MKKILIIGGGFGGMRLARLLGRITPVTLINDSPYFRYSPTLYRAATGKRMASVRFPLDWMLLDTPKVQLKIARVTSMNSHARTVTLDTDETLSYDYAAFALGSVTNYFNIKGLSEHSQGIKSHEEVDELRRHLHASVLRRSAEAHNYVIVGAGPTGVELSGALAHHLAQMARKHKVRNHKVSIWLVDSAPRVLPRMSMRASMLATKKLQKVGVNLLLDTQVKAETAQTLRTSQGNIKTDTVVWTAGTANSPFFNRNPDTFTLNERGVVHVNKRLQASPRIYVFGDNADTPHAGLAFSAIMNANYIARDITRRIRHKRRPHYRPVRPVQIVPTGNSSAVLQYGRLTISGRTAALVRTAADYIGYADVMGYLRALTIWKSRNQPEELCETCLMQK